MRSSILLALPAAASANQIPLGERLQGWWSQAQAYIPTAAPSVPNPVHAAAAAVANMAVTPLKLDNYKNVLLPAEPPKATGEPDEWLIYINGGNNTCFGRCENATLAWNASAAVLATQKQAPKLASIDCETEGVLCALWSVAPPSLYHFLIPRADSSKTVVRYLPLNSSSVTAKSIVDLSSTKGWERIEPYNGLYHPFAGFLAQSGLNLPIAYVVWAVAQMPSWLPMIVISLASRSLMGRARPQPGRPQPGAAPAGAPAQ